MWFLFRAALPALALAAAASQGAGEAAAEPKASIAMHGEAALPAGFAALPYVDADAPKGGSVAYASLGTFDSLNPFIVGGAPSPGTNTLVYETLMRRSEAEPFSLYPLIARTVETPDDRSWVEFRLDPAARFSDGAPLTADDVLFSFELLRTKGLPRTRTTYSQATATMKDAQTIRFDFPGGGNRELPLILASTMPIFPRHGVDAATFERTTLKPMIGSGPYVFDRILPGQSISFRKNADWWGAALPSNRGLFNFDTIRYDFYRDANGMFEAFRNGLYDVRPEGEAARWAQDYDFPAVRDGRVLRQEIANGLPKPMNAFIFNTRREIFRDARVREALAMLFDFEWVNRNLFYGLYTRPCGYFSGSELSACGRPAGAAELALLAKLDASLPQDILDGRWHPSVSDGSGRDRTVAHRALALLKQAGWTVKNGALVSAAGEPMRFEILVPDNNMARIALTYAQTASQFGIDVRVRQVEDGTYQRRKQAYDYDMMQFAWQNSLSPGNEQINRFGSANADKPGTFNFAGVKSEAVDGLIMSLMQAKSREDLTAAARALDRVLIAGHYVIPLYNVPKLWIARWDRTVRPDKPALTVGAYGDTLASDPILAHTSKTPP